MNDRKFALVRFTPAAIVKHDPVDEQIPEVAPQTDIVETPDAFLVTMDLPGAAKESIRVNIGSGELSVSAAVRQHVPENATIVYSEITQKRYGRRFRLGSGVDHEQVDAQHSDGVLTIVLPKTDALKRRDIIIH
jgi:HSP20 family protein